MDLSTSIMFRLWTWKLSVFITRRKTGYSTNLQKHGKIQKKQQSSRCRRINPTALQAMQHEMEQVHENLLAMGFLEQIEQRKENLRHFLHPLFTVRQSTKRSQNHIIKSFLRQVDLPHQTNSLRTRRTQMFQKNTHLRRNKGPLIKLSSLFKWTEMTTNAVFNVRGFDFYVDYLTGLDTKFNRNRDYYFQTHYCF